MDLIKSLDKDGRSIHNFRDIEGNSTCPLPKSDSPGEWTPSCLKTGKELKPHFWGYHLAYPDTIAGWFHRENYIAESAGKIIEGETCAVAERIRLIRRIPLFDDNWIDLAAGFARDTLPLPSVLGFPPDTRKALEQSFASTSEFLNGAKADETMLDQWRACTILLGRNEIDSQASHDWMGNSLSIQHAALAVSSLALLKRPSDGKSLMDYRNTPSLMDRMLSDTEKGMGLLFARGERLLDIKSDNFRVAKDISGFASKAVFFSVQQAVRTDMKLHEMQAAFVDSKNPRIPSSATLADRALSGVRQKQSQMILTQAGYHV